MRHRSISVSTSRASSRAFALAASLSLVTLGGLAACGTDSGAGDDDTSADAGTVDGDPPPPTSGFQIRTPDIEIGAGQEVTYCYYTTIDTTDAVGVKRWTSSMTPGSHHLILYFTNDQQQPDGTLTQDCGVTGSGLNFPIWTYSAQSPENEALMPDGVGMSVGAHQHAFVQMHYLNTNPSAPITAHVSINAETYEPGTSYQRAAAYITYNTSINVPAGSTGSAQGTCAVPPDANFFLMSTHSHHFSTHTEVKDGAAMVLTSDDWEHPTVQEWDATPHYQFASGSLTYHCDYNNTSTSPVRTGDSAETDEMCMAVGYFYPATGPKLCLDSLVVQ